MRARRAEGKDRIGMGRKEDGENKTIEQGRGRKKRRETERE